jgi:hypothetical protein
VVEERATEGALEEVVAQHELLRDVPQAQGITALGVVAHGQATGVGPSDETVVLAAVDLHLVLIEHMPQIAGDQAKWQIFSVRAFEGERCVGQVFLKLRGAGVGHAIEGLRADLQHATPDGRQGLQQRAVAVTLLIVGGLERCQRFFDTGEIAEQVIETAVLGVDHHHGFHLIAQGLVQLGGRQRAFDRFARLISGAAASGQRGTDTQYRHAAEEAAAAGIGRVIGFRCVSAVCFVVHLSARFA